MTEEKTAYKFAAGEIRSFLERYERLGDEKQEIVDQQKEVMAEAKSRGYDTKILRQIIALRKKDSDKIAEEEAILAMYRKVLGMQGVIYSDAAMWLLVDPIAPIGAIAAFMLPIAILATVLCEKTTREENPERGENDHTS